MWHYCSVWVLSYFPLLSSFTFLLIFPTFSRVHKNDFAIWSDLEYQVFYSIWSHLGLIFQSCLLWLKLFSSIWMDRHAISSIKGESRKINAWYFRRISQSRDIQKVRDFRNPISQVWKDKFFWQMCIPKCLFDKFVVRKKNQFCQLLTIGGVAKWISWPFYRRKDLHKCWSVK